MLAFAAVILVVAQRGEIEDVIRLLGHVDPRWLLVACVLQVLTYVMAAGVWRLGLSAGGHHPPLRSLMGLALAMLFSNQAVPSVGISGGLVVVEALVRRGTPKPAAMSALLLGLVTTYFAFLVAAAVTFVWVRAFPGLTIVFAGALAAFSLMAGTVTFAIFEFGKLPAAWQGRLSRLPVVGGTLGIIIGAPTDMLHSGSVVLKATLLQLTQIGLDALTLGVSLVSLGSSITPAAVLGSFVFASVVSRVTFAQLGIGTFEAGSVAALHVAGVPLEPALAATLVFRGLTLWVPMVPGLWFTRRALRSAHVPR